MVIGTLMPHLLGVPAWQHRERGDACNIVTWRNVTEGKDVQVGADARKGSTRPVTISKILPISWNPPATECRPAVLLLRFGRGLRLGDRGLGLGAPRVETRVQGAGKSRTTHRDRTRAPARAGAGAGRQGARHR
jgi:hypothetical protein